VIIYINTSSTGLLWVPLNMGMRAANCQGISECLESGPSVLWCCWLGLLTCKTHHRVGEPTAAWQFVDVRQHRSFDSGRQYISCGQRQPPLSGAPVNKWLSVIMRERRIPPDLESGGIPHLFGTCLSPHIGSAWRARHNNNNNNNKSGRPV